MNAADQQNNTTVSTGMLLLGRLENNPPPQMYDKINEKTQIRKAQLGPILGPQCNALHFLVSQGPASMCCLAF